MFKVASHSSQQVNSDLEEDGGLERAFQAKRGPKAKTVWAAECQWPRVSGEDSTVRRRAACLDESTALALAVLELCNWMWLFVSTIPVSQCKHTHACFFLGKVLTSVLWLSPGSNQILLMNCIFISYFQHF